MRFFGYKEGEEEGKRDLTSVWREEKWDPSWMDKRHCHICIFRLLMNFHICMCINQYLLYVVAINKYINIYDGLYPPAKINIKMCDVFY